MIKRKHIIIICGLYLVVVFLLNNIAMINEILFEDIKHLTVRQCEFILDNSLYAECYAKGSIETSNTYNDFLVKKIENNINTISYIKLKVGVDIVSYSPNIRGTVKNSAECENNVDNANDTNNTEKIRQEVYANIGNNENKIVLSKEQLADFDFLVNNLYVVTERAQVLPSDIDGTKLSQMDMTMHGTSEKPQILIYHTHSKERFSDSTENGMSIVEVGTYLSEILSEKYGYNVIHVTRSFDEVNGVFDRSKAYTYATPVIEQILEENPSIEVVLDVHRDGLPEDSDKLLYNYKGKQVAQVMFFNGISRNKNGEINYLYNPNREGNLAFSFQLKLKALENLPGFTRKNYIDAYQYNLHLREKSVLIEVGAQNNTFDEVKYAMEPLAEVLNSVLNPK